ncbi:MAG: sensor domain-containing diguanylate cyclase [Candidatus Omnitrophota bacterium]
MSENIIKDENNLQKELACSRRELEIFYEISNLMRTTLDLNHILHIILTGVTSDIGLGFNRAILFLVNSNERSLEGKMVIGPESGEEAHKIWRNLEDENPTLEKLSAAYKVTENLNTPLNKAMRKLRISLNADDGGLLAKAYFHGMPMHIQKNEIHQYHNDPLLRAFKTSELVIMPLKAKDKVNGLIVADNLFTQKTITPEDFKIFVMLANQAGLAVENSRLHEMFVHKSHTDSLTTLWNHGFFQDTLAAKIEETKQSKSFLSLAIIDIDNFKMFNDSWGHQNGDIVLQELARVLKESSRDNDYVCRYGGEEFSIILTQTNKEQAYVSAERLREKIAQFDFPKFSSEHFLKLTVSIGIAEFPDDTQTKEELITKADQAMYTAKFIGKNKTCVA